MKKNIFFEYLGYRLKNATLRTLVFTILSVILSQSVISQGIKYNRPEAIKYATSGIYILATVLGIICTLIPILENMGFKNRRNLDTLYFFPIKRWKMALAHFLGGLIQVVFIYTVTFAIAGIYLALNTNFFDLSHLVPYYFLSLLLGFIIYSFFSFIFIQANTVADGVVMSVLWIYVLWAASYAIFKIAQQIDIAVPYSWHGWGIVYAPINNLTVIFQSLIEINQSPTSEMIYAQRYLSQFYFFIIWGVIGIACAIGYFITFVKKGAQHAGEISNSWFGYRLLIPMYGYSLIVLTGTGFVDIMTILVFIMMIIGYAIYRRSFRLKLRDIIVTALGVIPLFLGML